MDASLELNGLPCVNKVLLGYLLISLKSEKGAFLGKIGDSEKLDMSCLEKAHPNVYQGHFSLRYYHLQSSLEIFL